MIAGDYTLTFENAGGKKTTRNFVFETEDKAVDFVRAYNGVSRKAKITQAMKCIFPLPTSNISIPDNDVLGLQTMKIMYDTTTGKLCNCSIPFCYNFSRTELKTFLIYIKDFKEINNVLIDKVV